jgi:hypothetical protein
MKEQLNLQAGTKALLLCARCKEPVEQGANHTCKKGGENGISKVEKENKAAD